jgi:hypothetical protein
METIEQHHLTNGRPRRPCPPETRAYVDRLAREQGIRNWGRERRPVVIREPDEFDDAFLAAIDEYCTAEP